MGCEPDHRLVAELIAYAPSPEITETFETAKTSAIRPCTPGEDNRRGDYESVHRYRPG